MIIFITIFVFLIFTKHKKLFDDLHSVKLGLFYAHKYFNYSLSEICCFVTDTGFSYYLLFSLVGKSVRGNKR